MPTRAESALILFSIAALAGIVALASENIGSIEDATGFVPFYGETAANAGKVRPSRAWVVADDETSVNVSGWRWNGSSWARIWPSSDRGDTTVMVPAGKVRKFEMKQTDALFVNGTAVAVEWEW
jgi:hypothetical protein